MTKKTCLACNEEKPLVEFNTAIRTNNEDGRSHFCLKCERDIPLHGRRMIAQRHRRQEKRPPSREQRLRMALQMVLDVVTGFDPYGHHPFTNEQMEQIKEALK